jgi:ATP-binding cassette subfamily B protein
MFHYLYQNQRLKFIGFLLVSTVDCLLEVGLAYVMLQCVNYAIGGKLADAGIYAAAFCAYILLYFVIDYTAGKLKWSVLREAQTNLRNDITERIFSLKSRAFHSKNTGGWLSALTNSLNMIEESCFKIWFAVFTELFSFVLSLILLVVISPWLALFVTAVTALQMLVPKVMGPRIAKQMDNQARAAEEFSVVASEHLNGFDLLKSFQLTSRSLQAIRIANSRWENEKYHERLLNSAARLLSFTSGQILYIGIYFFGALLTLLGQATVGTMIAASQLVVYIASPLETLSEDLTELRGARELIQNLLADIADTESVTETYEDLPAQFHALTAEKIQFSYEDHPVLQNADLTVRRGGKYLLCGSSGAGKSTLIQMLTGALWPDAGQICVDGIPIHRFDPAQYARFILQCAQDTFLFNASVRDNTALFSDRYSDADILRALEKSGFLPVMERFGDGLDHMLSQNGQELSGGEKQKLALARLELYDPPVVIFDESFANIDQDTAKALIAKITARPDRTVILIAHQLSVDIASYFDQKIIIDNAAIRIEDI